MLLDTSGILCYFDIGERHNAEAVRLFRASTSLLTHSSPQTSWAIRRSKLSG
jgi:cupin superfamily acireductone dioxygenase involved in methionine salvage